jgi:hypothetical protein
MKAIPKLVTEDPVIALLDREVKIVRIKTSR